MHLDAYIEVLRLLKIDLDESQISLIGGDLLTGKHAWLHMPDEPALYGFDDISQFYPLLKELISRDYSDAAITLVEKQNKEWQVHEFKGKESGKELKDKTTAFIFFPAIKTNASLVAFRELVAHLRAPEGCPWDQKQTHQTLKPNLLEETYEVLDAIDSGNPHELEEELGDLMLQIVLHSQIASESGEFNLSDVIKAIHTKITFRHPHVFKDLQVDGVKGVIHNWEVLKSQERENNHKMQESILDSIPRDLPSLALAQKYQDRAARVGFDWPQIEPVLDKVLEEFGELKNADSAEAREAELGDLLFALVNVIRWYGFDAEDVLRKMTKRFYSRFKSIEQKAAGQGKKITDLSLDEMDALWELAKRDESEKK